MGWSPVSQFKFEYEFEFEKIEKKILHRLRMKPGKLEMIIFRPLLAILDHF